MDGNKKVSDEKEIVDMPVEEIIKPVKVEPSEAIMYSGGCPEGFRDIGIMCVPIRKSESEDDN